MKGDLHDAHHSYGTTVGNFICIGPVGQITVDNYFAKANLFFGSSSGMPYIQGISKDFIKRMSFEFYNIFVCCQQGINILTIFWIKSVC